MPNPLRITLTNPSGSTWNASPGTWGQGATVTPAGTVTFNAPTGGCRVFTSPTNAFDNEASNGQLDLSAGDNSFTVASGISNGDVISYCVCGSSETCQPVSTRETGGYTIKASS